eukprot:5020266-Pyramimonas_sp.AAC.1
MLGTKLRLHLWLAIGLFGSRTLACLFPSHRASVCCLSKVHVAFQCDPQSAELLASHDRAMQLLNAAPRRSFFKRALTWPRSLGAGVELFNLVLIAQAPPAKASGEMRRAPSCPPPTAGSHN